MTASRRLALALSALAVLPLAGACARSAPAANAPTVDSAQQTAIDFYRWYLVLLAHDKEASDDAPHYRRYVASALRTQIDRQTNSADGLDTDPFIRTQDYLDSWPGHIAASQSHATATQARTVVTLGTGKEAWRLAIVMTREDGVWKVAQVAKA